MKIFREHFLHMENVENLTRAFYKIADKNGEDFAEAVVRALCEDFTERHTNSVIKLAKIGMEFRREGIIL